MNQVKLYFSTVTVLLVGIFFAIEEFTNASFIENWRNMYDKVLSIIILLGVIYFIWGIFQIHRLNQLRKTPVTQENEDEINIKKDKFYTDITIQFDIALALMIFAAEIGFITLRDSSPGIPLFAISVAAIIFFANFYLIYLAGKLYPERKFPTNEESAEEILNTMDDGEKYVILIGLFQSYRIVKYSLPAGIMAAAVYSAFTGQSQIFSITLMALIYIVIQITYSSTVRNKI